MINCLFGIRSIAASALFGLLLLSAVPPAIAQNKVVVIPMGEDFKKVDAKLLPLAFGHVSLLANSADFVGIGVSDPATNITRTATGVYSITIDTAWNAFPIISVSAFGGTGEMINYSPSLNSNTFSVTVRDEAGALRDSAFSFIVYSGNAPAAKNVSGPTGTPVEGKID